MSTPNVLTGIIPTLYEALSVVSREMVGFIPAVRRDSNAERAAKGQTVRVPLAVAGALENITAGPAPADSGNTTVGYADVVIENAKAAPVLWNGEEERAVGASGTYNRILADQFTDAMRKLVNSVEADIAGKVRVGSSRAYGVATGTPFGVAGNLSELAGVAQILDVNGAPITDRQLVVGSSAMANLRGVQSVLFKVNEAGSSDMLRDGMTDRLQNFALRYSGAITSSGSSAQANYVTNGASAAGAKSIGIKTGVAAIAAGDIFSVADGGAHKYVVAAAQTGDGSLKIHAPGVQAALVDSKALTFVGAYTGNAAFSRSAIVLASRAPAIPTGGDSADDAMTITDPVTGLTFEVRVYRQYRQVKYEVCLAWGAAVVQPEHVALLIGSST